MNKEHIPHTRNGREQRNLLLACQKVTNAWMPVNIDLLERIKTGLTEGVYDLCIDFLIADLRNDISLFTFCLREIRQKCKERNLQLPDNLSPGELLEAAGISMLRDILMVEASEISPHELSEENELQMKRLKEVLIGASTAQTLSPSLALDPDLSFSTEVIRQLGLSLIAWNYPTIYRRTLSQLHDGTDLDAELARALGFSPRLLAIAMAKQWNLCDELRAAIGDKSASTSLESEEAEEVANALKQLCEIGEALARANDPDTYPTARHDWKYAVSEITDHLGSDGLSMIQDAVNKNCELYQSIAPKAFASSNDIRKEPQATLLSKNLLYTENKHIASCPKDMQHALGDIYQRFDPKEVSRDLIKELMQAVVPNAGFPTGCVFLLEPDTGNLTPRLTIGDAKLGDFQSRRANSLNTNMGEDPVQAAYNCSSPIVESNIERSVYGGTSISALVGRNRRVGVLYLEVSKELLSNRATSPLICFKAILHTLNDLLLLK